MYVKLWNSLGIITTFAAGNDGPDCFTTGYPGAYDNVITVGINSTLSYFSGAGPTLIVSTRPLTKESIAVRTCSSTNCGNQNKACSRIKPTLVARGENIRGVWKTSDSKYENISGTSMATPYVTGVVALMICATLKAKWNYTVAYDILNLSS